MNHLASDQKIKVCLVAISLGKGGLERSTAMLSKILVSQGFEVSLVILEDVIDYEYEGTLLNLGTDKHKGDHGFKQLSRLRRFKQFCKQQRIDIIIDSRARSSAVKEWVYANYVYKGLKVAYMVHSSRLGVYFPKQSKSAHKMVERASRIVGVSKAISEEINKKYHTTKACCIYNPIEQIEVELNTSAASTYIIFLGRMVDKVKNLGLLLDGYAASKLSSEGIMLRMYGDGPDADWLRQQIKERQLESDVHYFPFKKDIYNELAAAKFLALTSHYEGFPMVLIEALSVGTPVVSVDCHSGPNEVIEHEENGLLVENYKVEALSDAMNRFIFDAELYEHCASNAKKSVAHLSSEVIGKQWKTLLHEVYQD